MNQGQGGFSGAANGAAFVISVVAAYLLLPRLFDATWPWLLDYTVRTYGPAHLSWLAFAWKAALALLIYNIVRSLLALWVTDLGMRLGRRFIKRMEKD
ncbi:MAG: hypothetical protein ACK5II_11240 [Paracoccus sp. (in: a-proteobacteria)]